MTIKNCDMPAMPTQCNGGDFFGGLTKHEMMAMHMMAATQTKDGNPDFQYEAIMAVKAADALLAELERTK